VISHNTNENLEIGLFPNVWRAEDEERKRLHQFEDLLKEGGTPVEVKDDIQVQRWEKVVWNVAWNTLTTLTMVDTHSWLDSSALATPMTEALMREVIAVGRASGVALDDTLVDRLLTKIRGMPPIGSSMQTDARAGRPLEQDVILGVPYRRARRFGVPTPTLDVLYALILAINRRLTSEAK
jgi:2-dehydropantoate 2-reductase